MSVRLPDHLDLIAVAPGGIQKLRGLILELAVRGKLVAQDPNDEPASELLKRMAQERARLEAEGVCKKSKPVPRVDEDEQPFALPSNWVWVRLPEVYFSISPSSNKLLSSAIQEAGALPVVDQGKRYIAGYTDQASMLIKIPGPVVIFGDHTTERKYVDFDFVAGADGVKILRPILQYERFFFRQLQAFRLEERGYARHFKVLNDQLYALPPLAEQHRIVAKVDELMVLCDQMEAEQTDSASAHALLVDTLLATLTQSTDAADLVTNWQRLAEYFDTLFTTEPSLDALKQTILQLAVMGKLVPQDPNDEPASELLKRIAKERARLEAEGICKEKKPPLPVGQDEQMSKLPLGWEWVRFGTIATTRLGKMLDAAKNRGVLKPYLRNTNVQWFRFELDDVKELRLAPEELDEFRLEDGDLLICEGGQPGRCAIWRSATEEMYFQKALHRARPNGGVLAEYLQMILRQDAVSGALEASFTGATIKHFPGDKLTAYVIPLPPVNEQHRIVAKVDELMALCDRLKTNITESRQRQEQLSATLIESALEIA